LQLCQQLQLHKSLLQLLHSPHTTNVSAAASSYSSYPSHGGLTVLLLTWALHTGGSKWLFCSHGRRGVAAIVHHQQQLGNLHKTPPAATPQLLRPQAAAAAHMGGEASPQ
jgi:hypothetical protein